LGFACRSDLPFFANNIEQLEGINSSVLALLIVCSIFGGYLIMIEFWLQQFSEDEDYLHAIVAILYCFICCPHNKRKCFACCCGFAIFGIVVWCKSMDHSPKCRVLCKYDG